MSDLLEQVVPAERHVYCSRCRMGVDALMSQSGLHIRADCPQCGRYIKFVKQVKEHPFDLEPELYVEQTPW